MIDQLQTQLSGPYSSSFSPHSYCYELSNELKSVLKLLAFRFAPILGQPPRRLPDVTDRRALHWQQAPPWGRCLQS
jgi:hypothetical protein